MELLKLPLLPFQKDGSSFIREHKYILIGDDMGLGKTVQAIAVALERIFLRKERVLIICPPHLRRNWEKEFLKFSTQPLKFHVIERNYHYKNIPKDRDVYITSYSMLKQGKELYKICNYVVCDEAHYLKSHKSFRAQYMYDHLVEGKPEFLVMLSGTPLRNRVGEFYVPLTLLGICPDQCNGVDLRKIYPTWYQFCDKFSFRVAIHRTTNNNQIIKYEGFRNGEQLKEALTGKYIRRESAEVLDLPEMLEKEVYANSGSDTALSMEWQEYERTTRLTEHISTAKRAHACFKAKFTAEYVRALLLDGEGPILVYSDHPDAALIIQSELIRQEVRCIHGNTTQKERAKYIEMFKEGRLEVLVATLGTLSEGVTLVNSHNLVFNDLNWCGSVNEQAKKRIHRIGQDRKCVIHYMLSGAMDARIVRTLNKKAKDISEAINLL